MKPGNKKHLKWMLKVGGITTGAVLGGLAAVFFGIFWTLFFPPDHIAPPVVGSPLTVEAAEKGQSDILYAEGNKIKSLRTGETVVEAEQPIQCIAAGEDGLIYAQAATDQRVPELILVREGRSERYGESTELLHKDYYDSVRFQEMEIRPPFLYAWTDSVSITGNARDYLLTDLNIARLEDSRLFSWRAEELLSEYPHYRLYPPDETDGYTLCDTGTELILTYFYTYFNSNEEEIDRTESMGIIIDKKTGEELMSRYSRKDMFYSARTGEVYIIDGNTGRVSTVSLKGEEEWREPKTILDFASEDSFHEAFVDNETIYVWATINSQNEVLAIDMGTGTVAAEYPLYWADEVFHLNSKGALFRRGDALVWRNWNTTAEKEIAKVSLDSDKNHIEVQDDIIFVYLVNYGGRADQPVFELKEILEDCWEQE